MVVGTLFFLTLIAGGVNAYWFDPILFGPLEGVAPAAPRVLAGFFLMLFMSIGIVGIAIAIFPVLSLYNQAAAITYLCFRSIECLLLVLGALSSLVLLSLSQFLIAGGEADAAAHSQFRSLGSLALDLRFSAYQVAMIMLGFCSVWMCLVLHRFELVPRNISLLGLVGYACLFVSGVLDILNVIDTLHGAGSLFYVPGGLFELAVFPGWLIAKGFNVSQYEDRP